MRDDSKLIDALRELTEELTDREACELIEKLDHLGSVEPIQACSTLCGVTSSRRGQFAIRRMLTEILPAYPGLTATALSTLASVSRSIEKKPTHPSIEIVWTGPKSISVPSRRTEQVLLDLVNSAKQEVLIVSFAIYRVDALLQALKEASERGVQITLVAESGKEDSGTTSFDMIGGLRAKIGDKVRILEWPPELREKDAKGNMGALHAKCVVVDRERLFVSSANLTEFALSRNMEIGLLVTSSTWSTQVAEHFDYLVAEQVLQKR